MSQSLKAPLLPLPWISTGAKFAQLLPVFSISSRNDIYPSTCQSYHIYPSTGPSIHTSYLSIYPFIAAPFCNTLCTTIGLHSSRTLPIMYTCRTCSQHIIYTVYNEQWLSILTNCGTSEQQVEGWASTRSKHIMNTWSLYLRISIDTVSTTSPGWSSKRRLGQQRPDSGAGIGKGFCSTFQNMLYIICNILIWWYIYIIIYIYKYIYIYVNIVLQALCI